MVRVKSVYAVLVETMPNTWGLAAYVDDTEAGRKWIKAHGEADITYLIVAFRGGPVYVQVETTEKRTLIEQGQPAPEPEPEPDEEEE